MGVASLILGILSLLLVFWQPFGGLLGVICIILALVVIFQKKDNRKLAIAGLVCAILGFILLDSNIYFRF